MGLEYLLLPRVRSPNGLTVSWNDYGGELSILRWVWLCCVELSFVGIGWAELSILSRVVLC